MHNPDHLAFGVNYVPREQWWNAWVDFDEASIADDLAAIAALGCDHIRIQCLWPVFQPFPTSVSVTALNRLTTVLDRAYDAGLDVWVTVLNGFLSGWVFRPAWMHDRNVFTDPLAVSAAKTLLREIAGRVARHPAGAGIDIGNEPNMLVNYEREPVACSDLDQWARSMIAAVRCAAPELPVVLGADHQPWTTSKVGFSRELLANELSITTVHAWPYFSGFLEHFGEENDRSWAIGAYLAQVAATHQTEPRPIWIQEIGVAPEWVSTVDIEHATERLLRYAVSVPGVAGLSWWASHDIATEHAGFSSVEYDLGLLDVHNQLKPAGRRFRDIITELRNAPKPQLAASQVVLPANEPADHKFADEWANAWQEDRPPLVTPSRGRRLPARTS